jgi:hypothetical protein
MHNASNKPLGTVLLAVIMPECGQPLLSQYKTIKLHREIYQIIDPVVESRTYWLGLVSGTTWQEFLDTGGTVTGFGENRWKIVQQMAFQ